MNKYIMLLVFLISPLSYASDNITLDVKPGDIQKITISNFKIPGETKFSLSINKPNWGAQWSPYIYYSLSPDSGENSFRLSLYMPDKNKGMFALVEYYKNGKSIFRNAILNSIPLGRKVDFSLSWDTKGNITYSRMGGKSFTVKTHLRNFTGSIGVSSSNASFCPD